MSSRTVIRWSLVAALAVGGVTLTGCEDAEAAARAEADATLASLGNDLSLASKSSSPALAGDDVRRELEQIATKASGLRDGTAKQKAAASLIASSAHRQLGEIRAALAVEAETEAMRRRAAAVARIRAAARVAELADAIDSIDAETARRTLGDGIADLETRIADAATVISELDGPIADRRSLNEADRNQAGQLNREADGLRADARAVGYASGLPNYERAIQLEREASDFEYRVAARQNELEHRLEPEHRFRDLEVREHNAAVTELRSALESLRNFDGEMSGVSRSMRSAVAALKDDISADLAASDPTAGRDDLDAALDHARSAVTRGDGGSASDRNAASGAAARARLLEARLLAAQATALRDHATAVRLAAAVDALGMSDNAASAAESAAETAATAAIEAAQDVVNRSQSGQSLSSLGTAASRIIDGLSEG